MIYWEQLKSLLFHKWQVLKIGLRVGGIPLWQLVIHDWSKFTPIEFVNYSRYKYGIKNKNEWCKAWFHHLHYNPHHPEHWLLSWRGNPEFYSNIGENITSFVVVLPIPEVYVREMIVDFMATSKELSNSYDISRWLNKNGPLMKLHDDTITRIDSVMQEIGYVLTDNCMWSYMQGWQQNIMEKNTFFDKNNE
jgi:hypothetical protein